MYSFSAQVAIVTLCEAWEEARLAEVDPVRIGLIVGGRNFQQIELANTYENYKDRDQFIRPTHSLSFMDIDLCGLCTEHFGINGLAYTVGGASSSGQLAVIQAMKAVESDEVDTLGALMDLSHWECQALRSFGAMGSDRYGDKPALACRPFGQQRDGFIYGESCGTVVVERIDTAASRNINPYAVLSGSAGAMDGNRNPNPSYEKEMRVIQAALQDAGLSSADIDYINPHGIGSTLGYEVELKSIRDSNLSHAYINVTKFITGHGLSAAGIVEVIATLLQTQELKLHPTRNLEEPIDSSLNWVRDQPVSYTH